MTKPLGRAKARTKKPKSLRKGPTRRRQIIAAGSELFARNGFEGTSIRDIAAASGVLSGSLYYHFPSKEDLLFTVHQESLTAMRQEVETAIAGINEPWRRLGRAIVAHCRILLGGSVTRAILTPPALLQSQGCPKTRPPARRVRADFRQPHRRFALRADCDRHAFRLSILGAIELDRVLVHRRRPLERRRCRRQIALNGRGAANGATTKIGARVRLQTDYPECRIRTLVLTTPRPSS